MDTVQLMSMPLAQLCLLITDQMAREKKTEIEVNVKFKDITFTITGKSDEGIHETFKEYLSRSVEDE